jgi:hypothetical protein
MRGKLPDAERVSVLDGQGVHALLNEPRRDVLGRAAPPPAERARYF